MKKKMGRPPLGKHKKTEILRIRVTKDELRELRAAAAKAGMTVPELLMAAWRKEKK